ncbi:putative RING-H2 finger protein ATL36 isoform X2 [Prosopis cineraria]|uniref:putative RING-H2 finger protein ATL36 isoform X2 n=1 Tax=Prosopis cineraria TaxID=364024 RepID=UPI0024101328|nr:putative RING-H2 finger protein ATL36 isoform X2 [Prosopis cineraria]
MGNFGRYDIFWVNLVMTVIGFAMSTMFIVFVCTRLICARIHLNASRRSLLIASRSDLSLLERGFHGLEPTSVENFPTKKYSDGCFAAAENSQCTVCLSEYQGEDVLRILPYCGHFFHATCIDLWLQQHSTCPVCRISLRKSSERKRVMQPLFSAVVQSNFGVESIPTHPFHCMMANDNELSSRNLDMHGVNPVQEDHFAPEGGGTVGTENATNISHGDQSMKDTGKKHLDSTSIIPLS